MIYRVRHATTYNYTKPVDLAAQLMHLRPLPTPWQTIRNESLHVTPDTGRRVDRVDHFGNRITWLFFNSAHTLFEVVAESVVDVQAQPYPEPGETPPWEAVRDAALIGGPGAWQAAEFRFESPRVELLPAVRDYVAPSFEPGRPILSALIDLNDRMFRDFKFRSGVTTISTPIAHVLERREGVCQDFTHLMLSGLRGLGLPGRYTSGYIQTRPPPGQTRRRGADMSHAWVGGWLGPAHGWVGLDPTNGVLVAEEHVVLAVGRDFSDISPLKGMILGGGQHTLRVGVDLEPIDVAT